MALRWFRDVFGAEEQAEAARTGADAYDLLTAGAAHIPPGAEGLVALPHLVGAACPEFNPAARGVWFGIGLHHTKAHFVRAVMESVAYMVRRNVESLEELGIAVKEIRALGGGARSPLWNQIKADVLGVPVVTMTTEEQACLGAAILAGTAVGLYPSPEEAAQKLVTVANRWKPDTEVKPIYEFGYEMYVRLYESVEDLFTLDREIESYQTEWEDDKMIELRDKKTGAFLGTISEAQLQFLIDQLEEESIRDQDYYINIATLDMFEGAGGDPELLALLRQSLGTRQDMDIAWSRVGDQTRDE